MLSAKCIEGIRLIGKIFSAKITSAGVKRYRGIDEIFIRKYKNPVEPIITWAYGHFLKANNQPAGKQTYNEVVAWLIAYYKKFGIDAFVIAMRMLI